ncbi:mucoidy inhibitor MuiA family protein [Actinokineospora sp. HUAS TT18]|uniref:mucoidy inhibitor MuiA family protein n=1 Tax=Actinokineospora sp. HUAS TT18 TaxID=3447451 RepID=UPI003F51DF49
MTSPLEAPIVAVTVYPGQARVTRKGLISLDAGARRVLVGGLPLSLHPDSVRVTGRGAATVLGVDVRPEHHPRTPDGAVADLEEQRELIRAAIDELGDKESVLTVQADVVSALAKRVGGTFAPALARNETDPARVADVNGALARQLGDVLAAQRDLAQVRRKTMEQHDEIERKLADRYAHRAPDRMAVEVELEVAESGDLEIELSYLVHGGNWESRYDVRLADNALSVTWYGLITQHTGEDWPECDLRLSTAQPADGVNVPELSPWFVDVLRPIAPKMARAYGAAADMAAPGGAMPAMAAAPAPMMESFATVEQGATAATYRPARQIAVPADGTAHRTTVAVVELPTKTDHVTVPVRGPEAYLRATATNNSEHTLRPGRASIFHDNEFVGATDLETWAPGEEVELTLGVDERIRVERELVRRSAGKAVLGSTRKQEAAYRIKVGNFGPRDAHITVIDQVPVSRSEQIVVRDVTLRPEPAERTDLGEVTWKIDLAPGKSTELELGFRLDIAKGVEVAGWRD